MDDTDRRILAILQEDATLPVADVGARVGLSPTPCWRRIQKLRSAGVIERTVALVNPAALGLGLIVFIEVEARDQERHLQVRHGALQELDRLPGRSSPYRLTARPSSLRGHAFPRGPRHAAAWVKQPHAVEA
jgi:Lrp/AsnC family transcriptional regulator